MASYRGTAKLTDLHGDVIKPVVSVELSNDTGSAPSYARAAPFYGEFWVREGDLMISPLREEPRCLLHLDAGAIVRVRVNLWDRGGQRAQAVGEGNTLPTWDSG